MFDFNSLKQEKRHIRKVQLGAGESDSKDYINIDLFEGKKVDLLFDLRTGLPFNDNSIEEYYSHHVLEHFTPSEIDLLFAEIKRTLKINGKFISVLPDFEENALQFIKGENIYNATGSIWGCASLNWEPKEAHIHRYGWTKKSISNKLLEFGFKIINCDKIGKEIPVLSFTAKKDL